jgi:iron complex outermembrane receptor protein
MRNLAIGKGATLRASLLISSICTTVLAQTPPVAPPASKSTAASTGKLEEVVVTAQRRQQRLQDVPLAVTVLTGKQLAAGQTTSTKDLIRLIPNMVGGNNVGQGSANVYYIRGLGQTQSFSTFEPQVGTYVNDIYISRQNANNFSLFDVQDIQVLRGPQGTLFGRNSTGGAIVVTLDPPRDTFGGFTEFSGGDRSRVTGRFSVDMPITPQILTKTSLFGIDDNGYGQDVVTGTTLNAQKDWGIREAVRLKPNADITWDLSADYSDDGQANILNYPGPDGSRISQSGFAPSGNTVGLLDGKIATQGQGADVISFGAASDLAWNFDAGALRIITGYRGLKQESAIDFPDAAFGPLVPYDQASVGQFALAEIVNGNEFTQEVKWNGTIGSRLTYTGGLYYLYETDQTNYGAAGNLGAAIDPAFGLPVGTPFNLAFGDESFRNTTSSAAAYGQADYQIVDGLTATIGLRYTLEHKTIQISPNAAAPFPASLLEAGFNTTDVQKAGYQTALTSDVVTPRFALQYRFDPALMVFGSATKGFQGGGWNSLAFSAATFNNFGPEKVWSYETGARYNAPGGNFRAGMDLFLAETSHYQLLSTSPSPGNFVTQNAANLEAYGIEGDASWVPIPDLTLSGTFGVEKGSYNTPSKTVAAQLAGCNAGLATGNATLVGGNCASGIVSAVGTLAAPADLPDFTLTMNGSYVVRLPGFSLTPNAGVQVVGRHNDDPSGNAGGVDPTYALLGR